MIDLRDVSTPPVRVIAALGLDPHPEGGFWKQVWRDAPADGSRGVGSSILFLLRAEDASAWHRVDADEMWIWQAGGPLVLTISPNGHDARATWLGWDPAARQVRRMTVPTGQWQTAASLGSWTLVTCIVRPAFRFEGFELAPADWRPTPR